MTQQPYDYKPGDVANGHRLGDDMRWHPLPGYATAQTATVPPMAPQRKSHRTRNILLVLGALVVLLFGGCAVLVAAVSGSSDDNTTSSAQPADEPPAEDSTAAAPEEPAAEEPAGDPGIGVPVRDGKFEFVVTGVEPPTANIGGEFGSDAVGEYVVVRMTVRNIGDEAQMLAGSAQYAYAGEQRFDSTLVLSLEGAERAFLQDLNPGQELVNVPVMFDVPPGTVLDRVELHDSVFSGGVSVRLAP